MNLWIIVIFMVFWLGLNMFMMNRQRKKQEEEREQMFSNLQKGDEVVTIAGLHGLIDEINEEENYFVLDCEGIFLTFDLQALKGRATNQLIPTDNPFEAPTVSEVEETEVLDNKENNEEL